MRYFLSFIVALFTVVGAFGQTANVIKFSSIAAMKAYTLPANTNIAFVAIVAGSNEVGSTDGSTFTYFPASAAQTNAVSVVAPTVGNGRWIRNQTGFYPQQVLAATPSALNTYAFQMWRHNTNVFGIGADTVQGDIYAQSWDSRGLQLNSQGNNVTTHSGLLGTFLAGNGITVTNLATLKSNLVFSQTSFITNTAGSQTISPFAGQPLRVNLSTTGDFFVNTNQFTVDTSTATVAVGVSANNTGSLYVGSDGDASIYLDGTIAGSSPTIHLRAAGGSQAARTDLANGDSIGNIQFTAYSGGYLGTAFIRSSVDGVVVSGQRPGSNIRLFTNIPNGAQTERVTITGIGNLGIGQTTFGTSAAKVVAIGSGTAPSTSPADAVQMWSADVSAGNAALFIRGENGLVASIGGTGLAFTGPQTVSTSSGALTLSGTTQVVQAGGRRIGRNAQAGVYQILITDSYVVSTGTNAKTLPDASDVSAGTVIIVKSASGFTTTVTASAGDTVEGAATDVLGSLASGMYISDGVTNWEKN